MAIYDEDGAPDIDQEVVHRVLGWFDANRGRVTDDRVWVKVRDEGGGIGEMLQVVVALTAAEEFGGQMPPRYKLVNRALKRLSNIPGLRTH
jgi:hypothetical protein